MSAEQILRYLQLEDKRLQILLIGFPPECDDEMCLIDDELAQLRSLIDAEYARWEGGV